MIIEAKTVFTMGDPHGEIGRVNAFINKHHPDVLIINGDFALHWWEGSAPQYGTMETWYLDDSAFTNLKPQSTKIFWLMGNHQEWNYVEQQWGRHGKEPIEIKPNVYYCPMGSVLTINNENCLFVGGADSTDKDIRIEGKTWFKQERLVEADFNYIVENVNDRIPVMFSHTCPWEFDIQDKWDCKGRINDPSRLILSKIRDHFKPDYSFFGHWHRQKGGRYKGTQWQCLNTLSPGHGDGGKFVADISELFAKEC